MNSTRYIKSIHYPSLQLCKDMFKLGFKEEFAYMSIGYASGNIMTPDMETELLDIEDSELESRYPCPSIMEMLKHMPKMLVINGERYYPEFNEDKVSYSSYKDNDGDYSIDDLHIEDGSLPDSMARMILWLCSKGHLKF